MAISDASYTEHVYVNVCNEIDKPISAGDVERAQAMAKRAALGRPKVILDPNTAAQPTENK